MSDLESLRAELRESLDQSKQLLDLLMTIIEHGHAMTQSASMIARDVNKIAILSEKVVGFRDIAKELLEESRKIKHEGEKINNAIQSAIERKIQS